MTEAVAQPVTAREFRAVGLVTAAHFLSHFYQFVLPPVLALMAVRLDVGFTEMGAVLTVFSIATGLSQTPAGFLVDRLGAARPLAAGLAILGGSVALYGAAPNLWALIGLAAIAGMANSIFHPADFSILSDAVAERRVGRVFSLHAVSGNLGWVAAPGAMLGLAALFDLDTAFAVVGLAGVALAAVLAFAARSIEPTSAPAPRTKASGPPKGGTTREGMAMLLTRAALMLFAFQMVYAMCFGGIRNFTAVALPMLSALMADVPIEAYLAGTESGPITFAAATSALTGYLFGASVGNLAGGWAADVTHRPGVVFTVSILLLAVVTASLGAVAYGPFGATVALALAGVLQGSLLPARDMLVRRLAPPGGMGKLFGFTSSGLALGNAVTPITFGVIMDLQAPAWIFYASAACMLLALATYLRTEKEAA